MAKASLNARSGSNTDDRSGVVSRAVVMRGRNGTSLASSRKNGSSVKRGNGSSITRAKPDARDARGISVAGRVRPVSDPRDTKNLTQAETAWIWRRRTGLTLDAAGKRFKVNRMVVHAWEIGAANPPPITTRPIALKPHEEVRLLRRRSGLGLHKAATGYGVSHVHLLKLEKMAHPKLREFYCLQMSARRI